MAKEFGLTEKDVATNWRSAVRSAWGDSIFKKHIYNTRSYLVTNTNTRSMKRFPKVKRVKCAICQGEFSASATELDHKVGENKMTDLSHANDFIKNIFFTSPDNLQILCKDTKKKVKGKFQVTRFGCHSILTYQERYKVSFDEALISKQIINICKDDAKVVDKLLELGIISKDIPKTKVAKKDLLTKLMKGE